jgi:fatty-acid desaturase
MLIEESIILFISIGFKFLLTSLYMVCCVLQATNLVNNYGQRKSARTFASWQEASNKLYTLLAFRYFTFLNY